MKDRNPLVLVPVIVFCLLAIVPSGLAGERSERPVWPRPAAINNGTPATITDEEGRDGFSESAARALLIAAGYSAIQDLERVNSFVWRGTAYRDGQTYSVAVDYTGMVVGSH